MNSASTRFGTLVVYSRLGELGSRASFGYAYLVLTRANTNISQYSLPPEPEVPDTVKPYLSGSGTSLSKSALTSALTNQEYEKRMGARFNLNIGSVRNGAYFSVIKTSNTESMPGSAEVGILQQVALNALSDYCASHGDSVLARMINAGSIDYTEGSFYDIGVGQNYRRVHYNAKVSGIAAGNSVALGCLTVNYTEWVDGSSARYTNVYQLTPNSAFSGRTMKNIMQTMSWEGKKYADETVAEMQKEILKDYASYLLEVEGLEKAKHAFSGIATVCEAVSLSSSDTQDLPFLKVYTDSGSMTVYGGQVMGSVPFSSVCQDSYSALKDSQK